MKKYMSFVAEECKNKHETICTRINGWKEKWIDRLRDGQMQRWLDIQLAIARWIDRD